MTEQERQLLEERLVRAVIEVPFKREYYAIGNFEAYESYDTDAIRKAIRRVLREGI